MPGASESRWFPLATPRVAARTRLLCLPCAGGGASMYREWGAELPHTEVLAAQLPGREHRVRETPLRSLDAVVEALLRELAARGPGPPLVLFGHSMGALIAFDLARALIAAGTPPRHLIAAGARAPHRRPRRLLWDLPLPVLLEEIVRMGGTSPRVAAEPELVALIEPALRADLWLAEHHVLAAVPALPVPITVLGGTEDVQVGAGEIEAWREVAGAGCDVQFVRGGHFFVRDARAELMDRIAGVV